jgi:hypothetical protein
MKIFDASWLRHHPGRGSYNEWLDGIIFATSREEALGIALEQKETSTAEEWTLIELDQKGPYFHWMDSGEY